MVCDLVNKLEQVSLNLDMLFTAYGMNIRNENNVYLVAEIADKGVVGFLSCHSQSLLHHGGQLVAEIQEMYIEPAFRNQGIGKKLIEELKGILTERGALQLEVTSNRNRIASHRFYKREGFEYTHHKFVCHLSRQPTS